MVSCQTISLEDNLSWDGLIDESNTATFFQTKEWLKIWVAHWGEGIKIVIYAVCDGDELVGIAPLMISGDKVNLLAVSDPSKPASLSDFGDVIIKSGRELEVWETILTQMRSHSGESRRTSGRLQNQAEDSGQARMTIELNYIREGSPSFEILKKLGGKAQEMEVSPVINLPETWDEYLSTLDRHDRHELRRKMRKIEESGAEMVDYQGDVSLIEDFFKLMIVGNEQKSNFLSDEMKAFFRDLINTFWQKKMLDLKFLRLAGKMIAATLSFIFKDEVLLYNSGFDVTYNHLSPGLILKANLIKEAIEKGKKRFDFLRGREKYKYDLGGRERKLYKIIFD